jgi:hypothetical protein
MVLLQGAVSYAGATVTLDGTNQSQTTSETGAYELHDVAPGTYTVTATLAGYETRTSSAFEVLAGESAAAPTLTLPRAKGGLSGTALLEGEDSHAGISVMVQGTSYATVTDATGAWSISHVAAGNYAIIAMHAGFEDAAVSDQEVLEGQVTNVPTLTLAISPSSIGGTVRLKGTSDHSGASVVATASWNPSITRSGSTNTSGTYTILGVEPGMWNVVASKAGYSSSTQEGIVVQASTPTVGVDFELEVLIAADLVYVSGGSQGGDPNQSGTVYEALSEPFLVKVVDGFGEPVSNAHVTYTLVTSKTGGHMLTSGMVTTGEDGLASNVYVLGKVVGSNRVRVECLEILNDKVEFTADGLPDEPSTLMPMGGTMQSGVVGQELALPLSVEVQDQWGNGVPDRNVTFTPSGDGVAEPKSMTSDSQGLAATTWTLGTLMGQQTLTAACGKAQREFTATADHDAAHALVIVSGNNQNGVNTTTLGQPLVVELRDLYANPVDAVTVTFAVTQGTGALSPSAPQATGINGRAQVTLCLQSQGAVHVCATAPGVAPVVFTSTSLTGPPHHVVPVSGGGQEDVVGQLLGQPVVFRVEDGYDNPVPGVWVNFSAGATSGSPGSPSPATAQTGETGQVSTAFRLGTAAGVSTQWITATVNGYPTATLKAYQDAEPDEPASLEIVSGNDQTAAYGENLAKPLVVRVKDQYANPVWDYPVTWSSSTGSLAQAANLTDSEGLASNTATLGSTPGVPSQAFTAEANGLSVDFKATATGHRLEWMEPWIVWPGYPDPLDLAPESHLLSVMLHGAGFEPGALVVWNQGTASEELLTPDDVEEDRLVVQVPASHFVASGQLMVAVRNPGPVDGTAMAFRVAPTMPDTGQTQCFETNASGYNVAADCADLSLSHSLYGQDGHYRQSPLVQHSSLDNGDNTVADRLTGLTWTKCPRGTSGESCATGSLSSASQATAAQWCQDLELGGFADWRLPELWELATILELGKYPAIDAAAFPRTGVAEYWSATAAAGIAGNAWTVRFDFGATPRLATTAARGVRCVRGGRLEAFQHLVRLIGSDPVVLETTTGVMFAGCPAGKSGPTCATGTATPMSWPQALAHCESLTYAGYSDWRVPSVHELRAALNFQAAGPAVSDEVFPATPSSDHWSSSSKVPASPTQDAFYVSFDTGVTGTKAKGGTTGNYVRCVRRGF